MDARPSGWLAAVLVAVVVFSAGAGSTLANPLMTTEASYYENTVLVAGPNPASNTSVAFSDAGGDFGSAWAFSNSAGILQTVAGVGGQIIRDGPAAAFGPPAGAASAEATATWEATVTNNTAFAQAFSFVFEVINPRVGTGRHEDDFGGVKIDIELNHLNLWSGFAQIHGTELTYENMGVPWLEIDDDTTRSAFFDTFTAVVELGTFLPGESFTLRYVMSAFADLGDPISSVGTFGAIGDPFNFDPDGFGAQIQQSNVAIPEPGTLTLFALCGVMLGLSRCRRRPT